jgi:hypothetical protein
VKREPSERMAREAEDRAERVGERAAEVRGRVSAG